MSTHEVRVIRIQEILPHSNADKLELVQVFGWTCCIRKGSFQVGDLAAFIEPDYLVPLDRPEFVFLSKSDKPRGKHRIAVSCFRGVYSQGLLVPAPPGAVEGDNVVDVLGVERYEPPEENLVRSSFAEKGPEFVTPKYDLENVLKYGNCLIHGEEVILTAKIHGTSARFCWDGNRMWCGSRTQWKMAPGIEMPDGQIVPESAWWTALRQNPWLEEYCKANSGLVVYGEIFGGQIQKGFNYGLPSGALGFRVFDIMENGRWINNSEFNQERFNLLKFVPTLYKGKYSLDIVKELAEQPETAFPGATNVREGIVIKPVAERFSQEIGRVALKYVSNRYLVWK